MNRLERRWLLPCVLPLYVFALASCAERSSGAGDPDGGDAGELPQDAVCTGSAIPCDARDEAACTEGVGCTLGGTCGELPRGCHASTPEACAEVPGCAWIGVVGRCGQVFLDCTPVLDASACDEEPGCVWEPRCNGLALECDRLSIGDCADQPGCQVTSD